MLGLLTPIASLLGIEAEAMMERLRKNAGLWGAIAFFALVAIVFLLVAAHAALLLWVGPIWAPLIIAGIAALVALAIYLTITIRARVEAKREAERRRSAETTALVTTAAITALPLLMSSPMLKKLVLPVGGAAAALFLLARAWAATDSSAGDGGPGEDT